MSEIYSPGSIAGPPATFLGPYNAGMSYSVGQAVSSGGSSYVSLVSATMGNSPASSAACWGLLAAAGAAAALNTTLTFAAAGSQIVAHGLNTPAPIVQASVASGATRWSGAAIDANHYQIVACGAMVATFAFLGGIASTPTATVATVNLTSGLTNYWAMNEGSGSSFIDAVAADNFSTVGVTWTGSEASFSGSSSGAHCPTQPVPLDGAALPFTISTWVNIASTSGAYLLSNTNESDDGWQFLLFSGGALHVILVQGGSLVTHVSGLAASFVTGIRQNLILTYDGSGTAAGLKLYVNGVAQSMTIETDSLGGATVVPLAGNPLTIMAEPNGSEGFENNVAGTMDHLRIYNRVLATGEIAAIQTGSN